MSGSLTSSGGCSGLHDRALLVRACTQGDSEAVGEVYVRFKPSLDKYLRNVMGGGNHLCAVDVDDVIQEVFIRISRRKCRYSGKGDPGAFLRKTVYHVFLECQRAMGRHVKTYSLEEVSIGQMIQQAEQFDGLETAELQAALRRLIDRLPAKARQAVQLVHIEGLTPSEAAAQAGCSLKALCASLNFALARLRADLHLVSDK